MWPRPSFNKPETTEQKKKLEDCGNFKAMHCTYAQTYWLHIQDHTVCSATSMDSPEPFSSFAAFCSILE